MIWKAIGDGAALGVGLAMDAFSVSMVNGLREPKMARGKILRIAGVFGTFQTAMPLIGYMLVRTLIQAFTALEPAIPWIGFVLLLFLGGKMILEGIRKKEDKEDKEEEAEKIGTGGLIVQGIATSIDALSAGLTMAESRVGEAVTEAAVIGVVTFAICVAGVRIGRKAGDRLADKASVFGGVILVLIGVKIVLGL